MFFNLWMLVCWNKYSSRSAVVHTRCVTTHSPHTYLQPEESFLVSGQAENCHNFLWTAGKVKLWLLFLSIQSIAALVRVSEGDLRKAITLLQSAARLSVDKEITEHAVTEIAGVSRASVFHIQSQTEELLMDRLLTVVKSPALQKACSAALQ